MATPSPHLRFAAEPHVRVIETLARLFQQSLKEGLSLAIPRVTLLLTNGHSLSGIVQQVEESRGDVLLATLARPSDVELMYVNQKQIVGLQVAHTPQTLDTYARFKQGDHSPTPTEVPGKLELRRQPEAIRARWAEAGLNLPLEIELDAFPMTDAARARLGAFFRDLEAVILLLFEDPLGSEALRAKVTNLVIVAGDATSVDLLNGSLQITLAVQPGDELVTFSRSKLQAAIERVL